MAASSARMARALRVVLSVSLVSQLVYAPETRAASDAARPSREEIGSWLAAALDAELAAGEVAVESEAVRSSLRSIVDEAAGRLDAAEASPQDVAQAEAEMRRFAQEVVRRAGRRGDLAEKPVVTRGAIADSLRSLCPLYPIC